MAMAAMLPSIRDTDSCSRRQEHSRQRSHPEA